MIPIQLKDALELFENEGNSFPWSGCLSPLGMTLAVENIRHTNHWLTNRVNSLCWLWLLQWFVFC